MRPGSTPCAFLCDRSPHGVPPLASSSIYRLSLFAFLYFMFDVRSPFFFFFSPSNALRARHDALPDTEQCRPLRSRTTRQKQRGTDDALDDEAALRPTWRLHRRRHWNADRQVLKPRRRQRRLVEGCCDDGGGGCGDGDGGGDRKSHVRARALGFEVLLHFLTHFSCT